MLHALDKYGPEDTQKEFIEKYDLKNRGSFKKPPDFKKVIKGKLNFLAMIRGNDDSMCRNLLQKYSQFNSHYALQPVGSRPNHLKRFEDALWVVEYADDAGGDIDCFQGTGFFLEGYGLVTCEHAVRGAAKAFKSSNPTLSYPVTVLIKDRARDLAICRIDAPGIHYLTPSPSPSPRLESFIKVVGYPGWAPGNSLWMATGTVTSYKHRESEPRIVVSCPIGGGTSGGPVIDQFGRVIGIVSAGITDPDLAADSVTNEVIPLERLADLLQFIS